VAVVTVEVEEFERRDYTLAAEVLVAIGLRIVKEENYEPDPGLRESVD
jgi:hypothetical protein